MAILKLIVDVFILLILITALITWNAFKKKIKEKENENTRIYKNNRG